MAMLVHGVANPQGETDGYNGLYFTGTELKKLAEDLRTGVTAEVPIKAEHTGEPIGHVVSGFIGDDSALHCIMKINEASVDGAIAAGLVRDGIAAELSLGYAVDVHHSDGRYEAAQKTLLEISLVRKGARQGCFIYSYDDGQGAVSCRREPGHGADPAAWYAFDLE